MPRLRNVRTGSVVNVDDVTAARLGPDYEPADKPVEKKPAAARRKPRSKTTTDDE